MQQSLVILGRQPALGIAELESLYGADNVKPFGDKFALLDVDAKNVDFNRLGGVIKLTSVLQEIDSTDWVAIEKYILRMIPEHMSYIPEEGKFNLGLSNYGLRANTQAITRTALTAKKIIKSHGRSVRIVPNKSQTMSTPQVLHNHLLGERGWEIVAVKNGNKTLVCLTLGEQDIDAYTARDQARPMRDAFVGMLPPKLAQIIINLAIGPIAANPQLPITQPPTPTVLDPFCGTGVLLQEALLMGYDVQGTDIEARMVNYTAENLQWLRDRWREAEGYVRLELGDAQTHQWQQPILTVAAETYLGHPMSTIPGPAKLQDVLNPINALHKRFLKNLHGQLKPGTRLCLAVPAWRISDFSDARNASEKSRQPRNGLTGLDVPTGTPRPIKTVPESAGHISANTARMGKPDFGQNKFKHLPILDHLTDLGYNRMVLKRVATKDLIYFRPDQIVARELVILIRK